MICSPFTRLISGSRLFSLGLFSYVLLPANAIAADPAKCQRETSSLAAEHVEKAEKLLERLDRDRSRLIDKHLESRDVSSAQRASLRSALERVVTERETQAYRKTYIDKVVTDLALVGDPANEHGLCDQIHRLEEYSDDSLRRLRNGFEGFVEATRNRIALEDLDDDEGLVAIAAYSFGIAGEIELNRRGALTGNLTIGPLNNEEFFEVRKLKAGEYNWEKVANRLSNDSIQIFDLSNDDLIFSVQPGVLNYTGVFVFDQSGLYGRVSLNDRAAIVLTILEQRYPELLERHNVHNGLVETDTFIDFYLAEKRARGQSDGAE